MKILIVGDPHGKLPKKIHKNIDLILITGDIGKADLARKNAFENIKREKKGLPELEENSKDSKRAWEEIYNSTMKILKYFSKFAPVYFILGNVGTSTDAEIKKEEKKLSVKLPYLRSGIKKIKEIHLVRNGIRKINGLKIGFLEYFHDICWVKEFDVKDKKKIERARKKTEKARRILKWFGKNKIDILVCHQPPYGILDKVTWKKAPKHYQGKHAGSKVVLDYIKRKQPRYVFCGHIHEGKGKKKLGKTNIINAGCCGDYFVVDVAKKLLKE